MRKRSDARDDGDGNPMKKTPGVQRFSRRQQFLE
jgi:hypothetical protein